MPMMDKKKILNWLETHRVNGAYGDYFDTGFAVMIYTEFDMYPPRKEEVITFFDEGQTEDGSWMPWGTEHCAAITAQTLMMYDVLGATPANPLDAFCEKFDTWEKAFVFCRLTDPCGPTNPCNFWGEMWGPIITWFLYYNEDPPWWNEFDALVEEYREGWEPYSHFLSHVVFSYSQLGKDIPAFEIQPLLDLQLPDGSWETSIANTTFALSMFTFCEKSAEIKNATEKAEEFILACYSESEYYAWFTMSPHTTEKTIHQTWSGIFALKTIEAILRPETKKIGLSRTQKICVCIATGGSALFLAYLLYRRRK